MRTPLINALAERLDTSPAEARVALSRLIQRTRADLKSNRPVHFPGLGTFRAVVDDEQPDRSLAFDPDPALAEAINGAYVGLEDLSLTPATPPPGTASGEPAAEQAVSEEGLASKNPETASESRTPGALAVPGSVAPAAFYLAEPPAPEGLRGGTLHGPGTSATAPADDRPPAERETPSSRSALPWLAAAVVLLLLGVGGWLLSRSDDADPAADPPTTAQVENPAPTGAATSTGSAAASADTTARERAAGSERAATSNSAEAPADVVESTEAASAPPAIDRRAGGWTLVVSSKSDPDEAKFVFEEFQRYFEGEETPMSILPSTVESETYYRVGVGQFKSKEAALRALDTNDRYPADAWLLALSNGS